MLRWNSYETNILSTFEGLLDSEALSDVTLFCEGEFAEVGQKFEFLTTFAEFNMWQTCWKTILDWFLWAPAYKTDSLPGLHPRLSVTIPSLTFASCRAAF